MANYTFSPEGWRFTVNKRRGEIKESSKFTPDGLGIYVQNHIPANLPFVFCVRLDTFYISTY